VRVTEVRTYPQHRFRRPPGACELLLVRHGESIPARDDQPFPLVDGHGDPELDPRGHDQAERVADRLEHEDVTTIYVTTLQRTAQTAAPLATRLGITPRVEPDLREVYLGDWEGTFRRHVAEGHPIAQQMYTQGRWDVIPGAEPAEAFAERVRGAITRIAAAHRDEAVVVVSHGGTIGQILAMATGSRPFAFVGSDNGAISHIVVTDERWILRRYNDTAHLSPAFTTAPEPPT
jgi:2,3-bisphosphoglycerate-dependent phosphoglycerate mutase